MKAHLSIRLRVCRLIPPQLTSAKKTASQMNRRLSFSTILRFLALAPHTKMAFIHQYSHSPDLFLVITFRHRHLPQVKLVEDLKIPVSLTDREDVQLTMNSASGLPYL